MFILLRLLVDGTHTKTVYAFPKTNLMVFLLILGIADRMSLYSGKVLTCLLMSFKEKCN